MTEMDQFEKCSREQLAISDVILIDYDTNVMPNKSIDNHCTTSKTPFAPPLLLPALVLRVYKSQSRDS